MASGSWTQQANGQCNPIPWQPDDSECELPKKVNKKLQNGHWSCKTKLSNAYRYVLHLYFCIQYKYLAAKTTTTPLVKLSSLIKPNGPICLMTTRVENGEKRRTRIRTWSCAAHFTVIPAIKLLEGTGINTLFA